MSGDGKVRRPKVSPPPPRCSMTTFQKIDRALRARGWTYDVAEEQFLDNTGKVIRNNGWLLALVPGITLDHLVSYMHHKYDTWSKP